MSYCIAGICQFFYENAYVLLASYLCGVLLYYIGRKKDVGILACISFAFSLFCGVMVFFMVLLYLADYQIRLLFDLFIIHKELIVFLMVDLALSWSFKERGERVAK